MNDRKKRYLYSRKYGVINKQETDRYLSGTYKEKLAWTKPFQPRETSIFSICQSVPGPVRNL